MERPVEQQKTEKTAAVARTFTTWDRCDGYTYVKNRERISCGAQAFIAVTLTNGQDLLFCGHCLGEQTVGKDATGTKSAKQQTNRQILIDMGATFDSNYASINLVAFSEG